MASKDAVGKAVYQLETDPTGLTKGLKAAEGQIKATGATAEKAFGKQTTGALGKVDAALTKMTASKGIPGAVLGGLGIGAGIGVFSLVTKGIGMITDVLGTSIEAARQEELSVAKLTTALEANVDAWDGNTEAIEATLKARMALGFADDEQRDSLAQLVSVTKDATTALDLQRTAMDLARLRNMSLADASALLGKVYSGNVGILSRYGIKLEKGATATQALAEVQKRAGGQAEAWADKNKAAIAKVRIDDAMESIGLALIPLVDGLTSFASDAIPAAIAGLTDLGDAFNNLRRWMSPGQALIEDQNAALVKMATDLGLDSEKLLEFVQGQRDAATAIEDNAKAMANLEDASATLRAGLLESGMAVEDVDAAVKEYRDRMLGLIKDQEAVNTSTDKSTELWRFSAQAILEARAAGVDLSPTLEDVAGAAGGTSRALEVLGGSAKKVAATIETDLSPLTGIVKGSLRRAKDAAEKEGAEFRWAMEHPLAGDRLGAFWAKQIRVHQRRRQKAIDAGNVTVIAREDAFIKDYRERLTALRTAKFTVAVQTVFTGTIPNWIPGLPGLPGRAAGGPVQALKPYIVGEHRPELFVPDRNGTILPSVPSSAGRQVVDVRHTITLEGARNLRSAGYDTDRLAALLRAADDGAGYSSPRRY
jgi:hypothetical protein